MTVIISKFNEVLYSVLPITVIVLLLHVTLTPVDTPLLIRFLIGAVSIIVGLTIFLVGVEVGITPIGNTMGSTIAKTNKMYIVAIAGLILGFIISIAEPDLHILATGRYGYTRFNTQKHYNCNCIQAGIGALLSIGLLRIVLNFPLHKLLALLYGIVLILGLFTSPEFLAISFGCFRCDYRGFDSALYSCLAMGVAKLKKHSQESEEDSFGLVGIASVGAIISVMIMSIISKPVKSPAVFRKKRLPQQYCRRLWINYPL